jgi:antitoxin MazE
MEVPIIRIGNSKGIILSKTMVEKYGLGDKIEILMKEDHMELKPLRSPREGWDITFRAMHQHGDDEPLLHDTLEDDLLREWEWEDGTEPV